MKVYIVYRNIYTPQGDTARIVERVFSSRVKAEEYELYLATPGYVYKEIEEYEVE